MKLKTPVVWYSCKPETPNRGYWDMQVMEDLFSNSIWSPVRGYEFRHFDSIKDVLTTGSVIVLPARHLWSCVEEVNADIALLDWALVILLGDEESVFPAERLRHKNMRLWVQMPRKGRHDFVTRKLINGYATDTRKLLQKCRPQARNFDWFFSGQVTHSRRDQCVRAIRDLPAGLRNGLLNVTAGFTQGYQQEEYYRLMLQAKAVPCPSGACGPDSFRFAEALEAGCVPIIDNVSPLSTYPGDYWRYVFSSELYPPVPVIQEWRQLEQCLAHALDNWPKAANVAGAWWQQYKRQLAYWLKEDIHILSGELPQEQTVDDKITVLIPTSPIPSHPETGILEKVISSVRFHLPSAEIIIMMDGVRDNLQHRRGQYEEYKQRVIDKCNNEWHNVLPLVFDKHTQQADMTKRALDLVKTPLVMFIEHDAYLTDDTIQWDAIAGTLLAGQANMVRLYYYSEIHPEHAYLMEGQFEANGATFVRTRQYSQWPNVATVDFYRRILDQHFQGTATRMIETVMYSPVVEHPWEQYKVVIYYPAGNARRFIHLNGRQGDPADW